VSQRKEETEAYEKKRKKYVCRRRKMITNEKTAINENEESGDDDDGGQRPRYGKKPATLHYGMSPSEKFPLQYLSRKRNFLHVKLQWSVSQWHCRTRSAGNRFFHSAILQFEPQIILLIFIVFLIL
jgi:hypothetical protein